jgi:hypothetical protein
MWMQRFPMSGFGSGPFTGFEPLSPPLVLNPTGTPEQSRACDVKAAQERGPVKVASSVHEDSTIVLHFEGGTGCVDAAHARDRLTLRAAARRQPGEAALASIAISRTKATTPRCFIRRLRRLPPAGFHDAVRRRP